jgi:hypothetical protein
MKRLFILPLFSILFTACHVTVVEEPRYDSRDKLVGYYDMEEYSETYNDYTYYAMRISKSSYDDGRIYLHNFYASNISIYAILEYGKIRIPNQRVNGYEVEGVGTLIGGDLSLNYSVKDFYERTYTDFCETIAKRDY